METAVRPQVRDPHMPPPPPISASKQNRILIWRREVASALDEAASSSSSPSTASSASGAQPTAAALNSSRANAASTDSSFSSASPPSSRPRALWKRLSRRLAIRSPEDDPPPDSPRTAMYREADTAALEGRTVVDGEANGDETPAVDAPRPAEESKPKGQDDGEEEVVPGEASSSSDGGGRGLREKQERLQRAARLLNHGPKKEERASAIKAEQ